MNVTVSNGIIYLPERALIVKKDYNFSLEYYKELKKVLRIKRVKDFQFVRLGRPTHDGGYTMVDDFIQGGME